MQDPTFEDIEHLMTKLVFPFYQIERDAVPPFEPRRFENDAEHSWSVAFLACSLAPEVDKNLDVGKIAQFAIAHDVIEVFAGDTSPWHDQQMRKSKDEREGSALKHIEKHFARFPWVIQTIKEYELRMSNEAQFVWAIDKVIILLLRHLDKGRYYIENGVTKQLFDERLTAHRAKAHAHSKIGEYYEQLLEIFEKHPEYFYNADASSRSARIVPFFSNTDDLHCFEACFKMILAYYMPKRDFSWKELDKMSAKRPKHATWPQQMMFNLYSMGFDIVMIEGFDGPAFVNDGAEYLKRTFGEETAAWQIAHSNIPAEQAIYKKLLDTGARIEVRRPHLSEFKTYLNQGYLITCTVNSRRLNGKRGYVGHAIVVYDIDATHITFHDPGLPAYEARRITREEFTRAWADPNDDARGLIAVRLKA